MDVTSDPFAKAAVLAEKILKGGIYEDKYFRSYFWNHLHRMIVENFSNIHSTEPISSEDWMEIEDIYSAFQDSPEHEELISKCEQMRRILQWRKTAGNEESALFRIYARQVGRDKENPSRLNTENLNFEENFFN